MFRSISHQSYIFSKLLRLFSCYRNANNPEQYASDTSQQNLEEFERNFSLLNYIIMINLKHKRSG